MHIVEARTREKYVERLITVCLGEIGKKDRGVTKVTVVKVSAAGQLVIRNAANFERFVHDLKAVPLIEDVFGGAEIEHDVEIFEVPGRQFIEIKVENLCFERGADIERVIFDVAQVGNLRQERRTFFGSRSGKINNPLRLRLENFVGDRLALIVHKLKNLLLGCKVNILRSDIQQLGFCSREMSFFL